SRPIEPTIHHIQQKFGKKPEIRDANIAALKAGYHYGETAEAFQARYEVPPATLPAGTYRSINGNQALALGLATAAEKAGITLLFSGYPITPASDLLHSLSGLRTM